MITDALLSIVSTVVSFIDGLIPSFALPGFFASGSLVPDSVVNFLAAAFHMVAPFFPSSLVLSLLVAGAALWPAFMGYLVFTWVIRHTPTVAGFGLGS